MSFVRYADRSLSLTFKRRLKKLGVNKWDKWKRYSDIENTLHLIGVAYKRVGTVVQILLPPDAKLYAEILSNHVQVRSLVKEKLSSYQDLLLALLAYLKELINNKMKLDECEA